MEKVCIVGSGNWGSAIARIVGANASRHEQFEDTVNMWVFEETVDGRKLSEIINTDHENVKYLPGVKLPANVVAVPELKDAAKDATILVFVLPHQFLGRLFDDLNSVVASSCRAISLIKGIEFENSKPKLISHMIKEGLKAPCRPEGMDCSVLMGANVAAEVAQDQFCETTIGYTDAATGAVLCALFDTTTFRVTIVQDVAGVELCGALKNIVALGAGFADGLGLGGNTKAALIRIGLVEMQRFCARYYAGVKADTFLESCGVADLITTCYGGRNRKCAEAFAKVGGAESWDKIEMELLNGQKLQGTITSKDVHTVLSTDGVGAEFPLFEMIYAISFEGRPVADIIKF